MGLKLKHFQTLWIDSRVITVCREGGERVSIKHPQAKMNADYYRPETE